MQCLECKEEVAWLDNEHLLRCCSLTLQEYAIRHHLPLDQLVSPEQLNREDPIENYPFPRGTPSEKSRAVLLGLKWAGKLVEEGDFLVVPGEIRRLDLLLWILQYLREYGFQFRQEYRYQDETHRVVAHNRLKVPQGCLSRDLTFHLSPVPPPDPLFSLSVLMALVGELHAGYLFLPVSRSMVAEQIMQFARSNGVRFADLCLESDLDGKLLRTHTLEDTERLMDLVEEFLSSIPGALDRFRQQTPEVTVSKELVFDAAHFITDHPAKCSNLHGGRYRLHVKVHGRVDPVTGCVVDYGYLKKVVNSLVIERFDHHNLNYASGALAWRSSTEMLCIFIWEQLIDYLPGLAELQLYETPQSWCSYRGPSLESWQQSGSDPLMTHFQDDGLGRSSLRNQLVEIPPDLGVVSGSR